MREHIVLYNVNITGKTKAYSLMAIDPADAANKFMMKYPDLNIRYVLQTPVLHGNVTVYHVHRPVGISVEPTESI